MRRLALVVLACALPAAANATPAAAGASQLLPGVTYEDGVQFTAHGPVAIRIVRGPRPVGLYRLRPVLSNETVVGRETVSSMQRRLSAQATAIGVNGDLFSWADGRPSGILLRDGVLVSPPHGGRSSAGITPDGTLDVRRVKLNGTWRGLGQRRPLRAFNDPPEPNDVALFTSDWGPATPSVPGATNVILSPFPAATPNVDLVAPVSDVVQADSVAIAPGTAVLVARGAAAADLWAEAPLGLSLTIRLGLQPGWETVVDAIGGGPALVRDGRPVFRAGEGFTTSLLVPRHPRTAVGQLADGRIVLVTVDGRQRGYSIGMTMFELAQTMMRLGAVRAMALDGGGSTTLAFDGTVLNRPSDGRERSISTALMLLYSGVYAPPPKEQVVSPNGDGIGEEPALAYKIVRPSRVTVTLSAPDGVVWQEVVERGPGRYRVPFPPSLSPARPPLPGNGAPRRSTVARPAEGRWTLKVASTDDQGSASSATRRFWVNSTIGFLRVRPRTLRVPPRGGALTIAWRQTRRARVTVRVETPRGILLGTVVQATLDAGDHSATWNGRRRDGRRAYGGLYRVVVTARNGLGSIALAERVRVLRVAAAKRYDGADP